MTNNHYTKTAIVLHWLIGIGILAMFGLGWYMSELPKDAPKAMAFDHALYLLMLLVPVTGVLMALYSKYGLKWFCTDLFAGLDNPAMRDTFKEAHEVLGVVMLVVIIVHVLGAIKHKLIDKDGTMDRMSLCKLCCKGSCKK